MIYIVKDSHDVQRDAVSSSQLSYIIREAMIYNTSAWSPYQDLIWWNFYHLQFLVLQISHTKNE